MSSTHPREKILKCLEMTRSDNDGEALNAIRKANALREKAKLTWSELFTTVVQQSAHQSQNDSRKPNKPKNNTGFDYGDMFDGLSAVFLSESTASFVESLSEYFEANGFLTEKQQEALARIYKGHCHG